MSVRYPTYNLTIEGKKKAIKIHRLVAETFIPNLENKPIVNHKDGNTHNFQVDNLEWCTHKENSQHAAETGLILINKNKEKIFLQDELIPEEKWVVIREYPNYSISNQGRIVNNVTGVLKKTPLDNNGYPHTSLWKNGKGKTFQVHRLEYQNFYPEENLDGFVINHINGEKTDNKLSNLEKVSYKKNNFLAEYQTKTHACGKPVKQLDLDKNIIDIFPSIAEAQRKTGTSCISRAIKKHYLANGYYWEFC